MNYRTAREILSEAIEQLDEADGNPAPFGYHVKKSPSGRKRYIPKTQKDFDSERKKFYARYPGGEKSYWADINRRQREANHANRGEIAEAIEQLDELSKKTYGSYINKAAKDIKRRSVHGGFGASSVDGDGSFTTGDGDDEKENRKVDRRIKGIGRAVKALGEASNLRRRMSRATHHMASLLRRAGATPEEVRQGMTLKRTPAAKSGRALLVKAMNDSRRKEARNMPNYPYGKAESRRMSKYMD